LPDVPEVLHVAFPDMPDAICRFVRFARRYGVGFPDMQDVRCRFASYSRPDMKVCQICQMLDVALPDMQDGTSGLLATLTGFLEVNEARTPAKTQRSNFNCIFKKFFVIN
jgi:hypothetical protein